MIDLFAEFAKLCALAFDLGEIERATAAHTGRPETDTTHTVALLLCCVAAHRELTTRGFNLDLTQMLILALVHDMPEAYAGDVDTSRPLTAAEIAQKQQREIAAIGRIREMGLGWVADAVMTYEHGTTAEGLVVKTLDKMMPRLATVLDQGANARRRGLTAQAVAANNAHIRLKLARAAADIDCDNLIRVLDELFMVAGEQAYRAVVSANSPCK